MAPVDVPDGVAVPVMGAPEFQEGVLYVVEGGGSLPSVTPSLREGVPVGHGVVDDGGENQGEELPGSASWVVAVPANLGAGNVKEGVSPLVGALENCHQC